MKPKKTPCKKVCKKACECKKADIKVPVDTDVKSIMKEMLDETRKRVIECSEIACKAGEVLKFLLQSVKNNKNAYENLAKGLNLYDKKLSGIKVDLSSDIAKFVVDVSEKKCDFAESLFRMMVGKSKFDFTGFDVEGRRVPERDEGGMLAFEIKVSKSTSMGPSGTKVDTEGTIVMAGPRLEDTVKEFDEAIGSFVVCRPPLKAKPVCDNGKEFKKPVKQVKKPTAKQKPGKKRVTPVIDDLKKTVLECSKYAIPSSRVKFVADHVDVKHGNFVYEVRFFQKSYKSVPAETQSYERALLNVRTGGDRDDLIAKRFDKLVEGLKFNSFPEKK